MPRIEPIPEEMVDPALLARMDELVASGRLGSGTTVWPRVLLHHPDGEILEHHLRVIEQNGSGGHGTLAPELRELLRLANAQLVGCDACAEARYDDSLGEDQIACAVVGAGQDLGDRERLALAFQRKMHLDHWSIDDETFRELGTVFSTSEIVELAAFVTTLLGAGRFLHTLDMLRTEPPVIEWDHRPQVA